MKYSIGDIIRRRNRDYNDETYPYDDVIITEITDTHYGLGTPVKVYHPFEGLDEAAWVYKYRTHLPTLLKNL